MNGKIILLVVMCVVAGISFLAAGFYMLFQKDKMIKNSGYISNILGAITLVLGMLIGLFPQTAALLALFYMFVLIFAFVVLYFMFIKKK